MQGSDLFRTKSVWRIIAHMSLPALVSILVMLLYNMTDMYFVARTGNDTQVAAVSGNACVHGAHGCQYHAGQWGLHPHCPSPG